MNSHDESTFLHKESCPSCGSKDNLGRYSDGHGYCFGCQYYEPGEGESTQQPTGKEVPKGLILGSYLKDGLEKRGLTLKTCQRWAIQVGRMNDQKVVICNYLNENREVVSQKIRFPPKEDGKKDMAVLGDRKLGLYGKWLWPGFPRELLVITEGELDAASTDQVSGGQFASVSIPTGAPAAKAAILKDLTWISEFKKVVFAFDMDKPGRDAIEECVHILPPGKAHILELTEKDPNDMLKAGKAGDLLKAIFNARQYRPSALVNAADLIEEAMVDPEIGMPFWDARLTEATFGRRFGEIYVMGAGVGIGKTDWLGEQIKYDRKELGMKVTVFSFEQQNTETLVRVAGKYAEKPLHIPGEDWTHEEKRAALRAIAEDRGFTLYSPKGSSKWEFVLEAIEYQYHAEGCQMFYIDNLTAMAAQEKDEKVGLEQILNQMGSLVLRLPICLFLVSHLSTPEGKGHEEGARVQEKQFKGSRAIAQYAAFMFGMERNKQEEDPTKKFTTFRVLKDRFTGRSTGMTFPLTYDSKRGKLIEGEPQVSGFTIPVGSASSQPSDY
jgi:twinkle protein